MKKSSNQPQSECVEHSVDDISCFHLEKERLVQEGKTEIMTLLYVGT